MDRKLFKRIAEIFEVARHLYGPARDAVLASAPDVEPEVRELLGQDEAPARVLAVEKPQLDVGAAVGPYRIERVIGRGGMATVYLAVGSQGRVALKQLHPALLREDGVLTRFRREAALGARIRHPHVVRTLGLEGEESLVMEYVEGETLWDALQTRGAMTEATCRRIGREVAEGLAAIHVLDTVHRDLKPSNLIARRDGHVMVMDLGIALPLDDLLRLSRTGAYVGTVRYSAPEQLVETRAGLDGRADLYALGIVLYMLATGVHPLPEGGLVSTARAQLELEPRPLREVNRTISPFFSTLVGTLLAKRPDDRIESATTLSRILDQGETSAWWRAHPRHQA